MKMESPPSKNCVQLKSYLLHQWTSGTQIYKSSLDCSDKPLRENQDKKKGNYSIGIVTGKCTRTPREYGTSGAKDSLLHFVS